MEPPSTRVSIVQHSTARGLSTVVRRSIQTALASHNLGGRVSVVLANADEIRQLNSQFRGVDEVTDVLTFPAPPMVGGFLGDIAICVPYARTQAEARGIPFSDEIAYLALHGALHLAGFDDETEAERRVMQAEMARLGGLLGLSEEPQWSSILHEMEVAR